MINRVGCLIIFFTFAIGLVFKDSAFSSLEVQFMPTPSIVGVTLDSPPIVATLNPYPNDYFYVEGERITYSSTTAVGCSQIIIGYIKSKYHGEDVIVNVQMRAEIALDHPSQIYPYKLGENLLGWSVSSGNMSVTHRIWLTNSNGLVISQVADVSDLNCETNLAIVNFTDDIPVKE